MHNDTPTANVMPFAKSKLELLTAAAKRRRNDLREPLRGVAEDEFQPGATSSFARTGSEDSALND